MVAEQPQVTSRPSRRFRRRLFVLVAVTLLCLDQLSKALVVRSMTLGETRALGPLLSLTFSRNFGAAWGIWSGGGHALAAVAIVCVIALVIWGMKVLRRNGLMLWGLACLVGGALGNLVDRLRYGYVVDFLDFHFWPVFNFADTCVVIGACLIILEAFVHPGTEAKRPEAAS